MTPILELHGVGKTFQSGKSTVQALADVDLTVNRGECHAIVGESGSGKTTLGSLVLGLYGQSSGEILFNGVPLPPVRDKELRQAIQLVQQNPLSALNPRRRIGSSVGLPLTVQGIGTKADRKAKVAHLLTEVGLDPAVASRLPRFLSGGERQRVAIARALSCDPGLVVLDEPTSALDVLVQARVLRLLDRLRRERGLTYIFITHDLGVVRAIADRVSVFKEGQLLETSTCDEIFSAPATAYTRSLIGAVPVVTAAEIELRDRIANGHAGQQVTS